MAAACCSLRQPMVVSARIFQPESTGTDMPLDRAAVAHIAMLARIKVPESELEAMAKELDGILHWVEQLKEVDTANVEPMTGAVHMALPRRKDEITDGNCRDKVLANGPETAHGFFVVPKVVE
jgi:aspartyl-tRNA(Asn)/glutamyl-tRNA(Gln) amidotransferase subunit C